MLGPVLACLFYGIQEVGSSILPGSTKLKLFPDQCLVLRS